MVCTEFIAASSRIADSSNKLLEVLDGVVDVW